MENSINSIIKDMIETNQINSNNNINSNNVNNVNNVEIFKFETIIDDFRNNITKQLNNIEEEDKKQSRFRKRKKSQNEIEIKNLKRNNGLIIEGISITKCITNPSIKDLFLDIISKCRTVICCRCAPIQKSEMVHFVKQNTINLGYSTLAIGDGGNDVNMIKEASIGLFGKEGYQTAFNSDYAISKFKYLSRLLLYHGRFSLMRNSYFILYFFYKSTFGF